MRKSDVILRIAEKTGIPKVDVMVALEAFFKEVKDCLSEGEDIYIRGFGSFVTKYRAQKIGRNIYQNSSLVIPEHLIPAFRPAKSFVESIKETSADNLAKGIIKQSNKKKNVDDSDIDDEDGE
jgi:DNA-binding protein HU-beta